MVRSALATVVIVLGAGSTAALAQSSGFQGGPAHSGVARADITPPIGKRWVIKGIGRLGTPLVHDGRVYVIGDTTLHAFDAGTGEPLWSAADAVGGMSASGSRLFHASPTGIVARDAETGELLWSAVRSDALEPVADGNRVFVGGSYPSAYDAATGIELWHYALASVTSAGLPASDGGLVYLDGSTSMSAVQRDTGRRVWLGEQAGGGESPAVLAEGRVWGGDRSFDALTGLDARNWTRQVPVVAAGTIVTASGGTLLAVDHDGRVRWSNRLPEGAMFESLPLVVGSVVYVRIGPDTLAGYDLATGERLLSSFTRQTDYSYINPHRGLAAGGDRLVVPFETKLIGYGPGRDEPGLDVDPWRVPSAVSLSLRAIRSAKFGQATRLIGAFRRKRGFVSPESPVLVEIDEFPFGDGFEQKSTLRSTGSGYERSLRLDRNTRVRLRYEGVEPAKVSSPRTALVTLRFRVRYRFLSPTRLRARPRLRGPSAGLRGRRVAFYYFDRSQRRSRRLDVIPLRQASGGLAQAGTVLAVPRVWDKGDVVFGCLIERRDDGFGKFDRRLRSCGNR